MPIQPPRIDLAPILPEVILVGTACLLLLFDAVRRSENRAPLALLTLAGLGAAAWSSFALWGWTGELTVISGMVAADRFAVFFRLVILGSSALAVLLAYHYFSREADTRGELYPLLLFCTAGMTLLASAADLIVVFLALEVLSLSLYVMAGFSFRRLASQEASMKYFLLGAFSSAFFLFGVAYAYGATGTTNLAGMATALSGELGDLPLALIAAGLLAVGFGFKIAAVPFHMWTPDVYQGAPTPVTSFMAAGTKVAGFAGLLRVTSIALGPVSFDIAPILWGLAAVTMIVGSILAIAQTDAKRMLAYSSIAHAGFVLVGVAAANQEGISGAMFYLVAYAAMIIGAFAILMLVTGGNEERTSLVSFAGLGRRSPLLASLLALFLLSLAGIPPTAGFIAKVLVFQAAVQAGQWGLAVVGVAASVVAAFFYIRVIVLAYMQEPEEHRLLETEPISGLTLSIAAAITVVLGVFPALLLDVIETAAVLRF